MMAHFGGIKGIIKVQKKFAVSRKSAIRREQTWLNKVLWGLFWLALVATARAFWLYIRDHDHSGLVITSFIFIFINVVVLLSFLLHLRAYERQGQLTLLQGTRAKPRETYNHITFTFDKKWVAEVVPFMD